MKYAFIRAHASMFKTAVLCRVVQVSRSGYYDWLKRTPSRRSQRRKELGNHVAASFYASREVYGYRKVHADLIQEKHVNVCGETVRRVMRERGLRSKVKRKFVVTTDSKHTCPVHANLLQRNFTAESPNRTWTADITYIRTQQGWLYLAAVMDVFSRRIVGWAFSQRIDATLVRDALAMAIMHRRPGKGLVHHSDQGVQYASETFQNILDDNGVFCSMSNKGDPWDNACQESFFGKLEGEHIRDRIYHTRAEAEQHVFWYIELFYNRQRRHASLGYVCPVEFERHAAHNQVT